MKFENNFLRADNGVVIAKYSSNMEGCEVNNILNADN